MQVKKRNLAFVNDVEAAAGFEHIAPYLLPISTPPAPITLPSEFSIRERKGSPVIPSAQLFKSRDWATRDIVVRRAPASRHIKLSAFS